VKTLPSPKRALEVAQGVATVFGLVGLLWGAYVSLDRRAESLVTAEDLARHDSDHAAHAFLLNLNQQCEGRADALRAELRGQKDSAVELGAQLVRMAASDRESRPELRARSAAKAEQRYRHALRRGASIEEALREALRHGVY
jgi:hypothetical protein